MFISQFFGGVDETLRSLSTWTCQAFPFTNRLHWISRKIVSTNGDSVHNVSVSLWVSLFPKIIQYLLRQFDRLWRRFGFGQIFDSIVAGSYSHLTMGVISCLLRKPLHVTMDSFYKLRIKQTIDVTTKPWNTFGIVFWKCWLWFSTQRMTRRAINCTY